MRRGLKCWIAGWQKQQPKVCVCCIELAIVQLLFKACTNRYHLDVACRRTYLVSWPDPSEV